MWRRYLRGHISVLIACLFVLAGCASQTAIQSSAFVDPAEVQHVYLMPIVAEIAVAPDFKGSVVEAREVAKENLFSLDGYVAQFLEDRGYHITGIAPSIYGADVGDSESVISAWKQVLDAQRSRSVSMNITETDDGTVVLSLDSADSAPAFELELPKSTDSVLFLAVRSTIAKRGFFNSKSEACSLQVSAELYQMVESNRIMVHSASLAKADILDLDEAKLVTGRALAILPVKLN